MTDLSFEWVTTQGSSAVLLPVGTAKYARMRFYGSAGVEPDPEVDGCLVFGETVEVSADFVRRLVLDLNDGTVKMSRLEHPVASLMVNSTLDAFVTSVAAYEILHRRLLGAGSHPQFEELTETAIALLVQLDPATGAQTNAWWPTRLAAVGRLV